MNCPNCSDTNYIDGETCVVCGIGPRVGPCLEVEVPSRKIEGEIQCPRCRAIPPAFNNLDCSRCGYSRTNKRKRAHGKVLT